MKSPIIGVLPLFDTEKQSVWMLPGYLKGIEEAGGTPLILPYTDNSKILLKVCKLCDGFLFTGGQDVCPSLYGESDKNSVDLLPTLDNLTKTVFDYATSKDLPILGICRGIQILNVFFGGTLYQDLPTEHPSNFSHHQEKPYLNPCHKVSLSNGSYLNLLLGTDLLLVNSIHHQAIKKLGQNLEVEAISVDGLVEGIKANNYKYILGVQWHPEYNFEVEKSSKTIFKSFIDACL